MATFGAWQATIQNEFGDILPGSEVEVFLESTGLNATIFSGRTGGALSNPFFADGDAFAQFYAAPGEYRIVATDGGSGFTNTWRYQDVGAILAIQNTLIKNYLVNANLNTTIINQMLFGGGQPAANVYGYDFWKGDVLGTRIEQVVNNSEVINETFTISWVGGTGTADVDGVTGLSSGDSFTINTSGIFSVTVPTDATCIVLNKGDFQIPFPTIDFDEELQRCKSRYERFDRDQGDAFPLQMSQAHSTTQARFHLNYMVEKISMPAITISGQAMFVLHNATASSIATTNMSGSASGTKAARFTATVAGGLVAGNASLVGMNSGAIIEIDSNFF